VMARLLISAMSDELLHSWLRSRQVRAVDVAAHATSTDSCATTSYSIQTRPMYVSRWSKSCRDCQKSTASHIQGGRGMISTTTVAPWNRVRWSGQPIGALIRARVELGVGRPRDPSAIVPPRAGKRAIASQHRGSDYS
jgi:hypothetical protein